MAGNKIRGPTNPEDPLARDVIFHQEITHRVFEGTCKVGSATLCFPLTKLPSMSSPAGAYHRFQRLVGSARELAGIAPANGNGGSGSGNGNGYGRHASNGSHRRNASNGGNGFNNGHGVNGTNGKGGKGNGNGKGKGNGHNGNGNGGNGSGGGGPNMVLLSHRASLHAHDHTFSGQSRLTVDTLHIYILADWQLFEMLMAARARSSKSLVVDIVSVFRRDTSSRAGTAVALAPQVAHKAPMPTTVSQKERLEDFLSWALDEFKRIKHRVLDPGEEAGWRNARKVLVEKGFSVPRVAKVSSGEWEGFGVPEKVGRDIQDKLALFVEWERYVNGEPEAAENCELVQSVVKLGVQD